MQIVLAAARQPERAFATDPVLKEVNYGDWEGLTLIEIGERFPEAAAARDADKWRYVPRMARATPCSPTGSKAGSRRSKGRPSSSRMAACSGR